MSEGKSKLLGILSARSGQDELEDMLGESEESQPELTEGETPKVNFAEVEDDVAKLEQASRERFEITKNPEGGLKGLAAREAVVEEPEPAVEVNNKPSETNRKFMQMIREKPANCRKYLGRTTRK